MRHLYISYGPTLLWTTKQRSLEPRARLDLHRGRWGTSDGRGQGWMTGVMLSTPGGQVAVRPVYVWWEEWVVIEGNVVGRVHTDRPHGALTAEILTSAGGWLYTWWEVGTAEGGQMDLQHHPVHTHRKGPDFHNPGLSTAGGSTGATHRRHRSVGSVGTFLLRYGRGRLPTPRARPQCRPRVGHATARPCAQLGAGSFRHEEVAPSQQQAGQPSRGSVPGSAALRCPLVDFARIKGCQQLSQPSRGPGPATPCPRYRHVHPRPPPGGQTMTGPCHPQIFVPKPPRRPQRPAG